MNKQIIRKISIAIGISLVANLCASQELLLTCEGIRTSDIVDRDVDNRSEILRVQQIPAKSYVETFIIKNGKLFSSEDSREVSRCNVGQYLIKCNTPLSTGIGNTLFYSELEIDRISGSISKTNGDHTFGGRVSGQNSVQIWTSYVKGICKKTNQIAF